MADIQPWYAHEHPDRPLTQGAFLCCCLLCAVSLERCGQEDANRPIVFHTGWGTRSWNVQSVAWHRAEQALHDMAEYVYLGAGPGNWIKAVTVGPRRGRAARGYEPEGPYPRPLQDWPVCSHCGPLSSATFATIVDFGAKPRRRTAKRVAADEASRLARAALTERVEALVAEHRRASLRAWRSGFLPPLAVVPDHLPEESEDW